MAVQETQETWVSSLDWEDPLEKEMATQSDIPVWRIPWTEEPRGLQSLGSQRVGHNWSDWAHTHTHTQTHTGFPGSKTLKFKTRIDCGQTVTADHPKYRPGFNFFFPSGKNYFPTQISSRDGQDSISCPQPEQYFQVDLSNEAAPLGSTWLFSRILVPTSPSLGSKALSHVAAKSIRMPLC